MRRSRRARCWICKRIITKKARREGNVSKLVGGSCPKRGRPHHKSCYDEFTYHLFR